MEDLEGHCAGEQGCMPDPRVAENMVTHKQVEDKFKRIVQSPLRYYLGKIMSFFKDYV